jgi:hypothetical protein
MTSTAITTQRRARRCRAARAIRAVVSAMRAGIVYPSAPLYEAVGVRPAAAQ